VSKVNLTPEALVAEIKDLLAPPEVALRIARMVDDPDSTIDDIGREISNDAALTARLLQVANGALYGQHRQIATVNRAITVLGTRQVRDLTVGIIAIRTFGGIANDLVNMESFWRQSVLCAVAASHIAARRARDRGESPFMAGLLHDIGQIVIFSRIPDLARQALLIPVDAADYLDYHLCEREVLGFDHGAVGAALAQHWGLPPSLQECIQYHHQPQRAQSYPLEVATVHIADCVAVLAETGSAALCDAPAISPAALLAAQVNSASVMEIVQQTRESAAEILSLLGAGLVAPPAPGDAARMVTLNTPRADGRGRWVLGTRRR